MPISAFECLPTVIFKLKSYLVDILGMCRSDITVWLLGYSFAFDALGVWNRLHMLPPLLPPEETHLSILTNTYGYIRLELEIVNMMLGKIVWTVKVVFT